MPCYAEVSVGTLDETAQAFLSVNVRNSGIAATLGGWCTVSMWLIAQFLSGIRQVDTTYGQVFSVTCSDDVLSLLVDSLQSCIPGLL